MVEENLREELAKIRKKVVAGKAERAEERRLEKKGAMIREREALKAQRRAEKKARKEAPRKERAKILKQLKEIRRKKKEQRIIQREKQKIAVSSREKFRRTPQQIRRFAGRRRAVSRSFTGGAVGMPRQQATFQFPRSPNDSVLQRQREERMRGRIVTGLNSTGLRSGSSGFLPSNRVGVNTSVFSRKKGRRVIGLN